MTIGFEGHLLYPETAWSLGISLSTTLVSECELSCRSMTYISLPLLGQR